jgi:molecular chaperone Hsp33
METILSSDLSSDGWVKCIATQGNIRGVAIQAADLIQTISDRHQLKGAAIRSLGELIMGSLLIASCCKTGERVNLNIQGNGLIKQALADAYPEGKVRGYVIENREHVLGDEKWGPWGAGLLSVLRTQDEENGRPYIGTVPLLTGHLAKDLSFYWAQSEQIPSAVGLAVNLEGDRVTSAGGFLVQALAGADMSEVKIIEHHINEIDSLAKKLANSMDPLHLLSQIFQSTAFVIIEKKRIAFDCNCSWKRVERALVLVGTAELETLLAQEQTVSVRCDFCATEYRIERAILEKLIDLSKG